MATIIRIKRSSNATAPSTLKLGDMAYAYGTGTASNGGDRLYIGIFFYGYSFCIKQND